MGDRILEFARAGLPTGFFRAGNDAFVTHVAETDPAELELAVDGARTPAQRATMLDPGAVFRLAIRFFDFRLAGHSKPRDFRFDFARLLFRNRYNNQTPGEHEIPGFFLTIPSATAFRFREAARVLRRRLPPT